MRVAVKCADAIIFLMGIFFSLSFSPTARPCSFSTHLLRYRSAQIGAHREEEKERSGEAPGSSARARVDFDGVTDFRRLFLLSLSMPLWLSSRLKKPRLVRLARSTGGAGDRDGLSRVRRVAHARGESEKRLSREKYREREEEGFFDGLKTRNVTVTRTLGKKEKSARISPPPLLVALFFLSLTHSAPCLGHQSPLLLFLHHRRAPCAARCGRGRGRGPGTPSSSTSTSTLLVFLSKMIGEPAFTQTLEGEMRLVSSPPIKRAGDGGERQ